MLQINSLKAFVYAVELKNFTKAAAKLKVSPMAISKQVRLLEKKLGITLFFRTTRRVNLTDNGKLIYEKCRTILNNLHALENYSAEISQTPSGTLQIATTHSFGPRFVLPYLNQFLNLYPEIKVELHTLDRTISLEKENIDLLIGLPLENIASQENILVASKLLESRRVLCVSKTYIKKHGEIRKLSDMEHHYYINNIYRPVDPFLEKCTAHNIAPLQRIFLDSNEEILQCVANGFGVALLPQFILNHKHNNILILDNLYKEAYENIYLFYKKTEFIDPKIIKFKEFLLKKINALNKKSKGNLKHS